MARTTDNKSSKKSKSTAHKKPEKSTDKGSTPVPTKPSKIKLNTAGRSTAKPNPSADSRGIGKPTGMEDLIALSSSSEKEEAKLAFSCYQL